MSALLHERMVVPEYWGDPIEAPKVPFTVKIGDEIFASHMLAIRAAASVVDLHKKGVRKGIVTDTFSSGQELPVVPRFSGLIRIVEDSITTPHEPSFLRRFFDKFSGPSEPETFNEQGMAILSDKLYDDKGICTDALTPDEVPARIWRTVWYMTGSRSGQQLEGITSGELSASNHSQNRVIPPLVVGQSYYRGSKQTTVSKIVAADVIIAGRSKRRKPPKEAKRKLELVPRLGYGFNGA